MFFVKRYIFINLVNFVNIFQKFEFIESSVSTAG